MSPKINPHGVISSVQHRKQVMTHMTLYTKIEVCASALLPVILLKVFLLQNKDGGRDLDEEGGH